jgi:putative ABC transport system ATP-binding protein
MFGRWRNHKTQAGTAVNGRYRHGNRQLIELRQVVKTYHSEAGDFTALEGVDLQVSAGEFAAIIGKSGSGKSTLINMVTGIDRPTSGEVLVGDTAVHTLTENQIAAWRGRNVGIVFQFFQLLPTMTALENIILPMAFCRRMSSGERRARALKLLEDMDMVDHAYKLPSAMSGGQQQRVAIARALANDPPLIVADEPTGNLDTKTANAVFRLFEHLVEQGKTIVIVTHDNTLAERVQRAITVIDGMITSDVACEVSLSHISSEHG